MPRTRSERFPRSRTARAALLGCAVSLTLCAAAAQTRGVLLDSNGEPLAAGTNVAAGIVVLGVAYGLDPIRPLVVGDGGTFSLPGGAPHFGPRGPQSVWLHVRRTVAGKRERILVEVTDTELGRLRFVPEQRLATGVVVDSHAKAVPKHGYGLIVEEAPAGAAEDGAAEARAANRNASERLSVQRTIDPQWRRGEFGRFELWGWRWPGEYRMTARYLDLELESARHTLPLEFGDHVRFELPATGYLQVQLSCPEGFPETKGAFAVLRAPDETSADRREQRRWLMAKSPTNLRVPTGTYAVRIELHGQVVQDLGQRVIRHARTTEVAADLRETTRILRLSVLDERGEPIMPARATVVGSPDAPFSHRPVKIAGNHRWLITLPVLAGAVDVELPCAMRKGRPRFGTGPDTIVVRGIEGDAVLTLREPKAAGESWTFAVRPLR